MAWSRSCLRIVGQASGKVSGGIVGHQPDHLGEVRDRVVVVVLCGKFQAAAVVGVGGVGIDLDDVGVVGDGGVEVAFGRVGGAAAEASYDEGGGQPDRLVEVGDGAVVVAHAGIGVAAIVEAGGEPGVDLDHFAVVGDGAFDVSLASNKRRRGPYRPRDSWDRSGSPRCSRPGRDRCRRVHDWRCHGRGKRRRDRGLAGAPTRSRACKRPALPRPAPMRAGICRRHPRLPATPGSGARPRANRRLRYTILKRACLLLVGRKCRRQSIIADDSARNRRRLQPLPGADRAADGALSHDTAAEKDSPPKNFRSSPVLP